MQSLAIPGGSSPDGISHQHPEQEMAQLRQEPFTTGSTIAVGGGGGGGGRRKGGGEEEVGEGDGEIETRREDGTL